MTTDKISVVKVIHVFFTIIQYHTKVGKSIKKYVSADFV